MIGAKGVLCPNMMIKKKITRRKIMGISHHILLRQRNRNKRPMIPRRATTVLLNELSLSKIPIYYFSNCRVDFKTDSAIAS